MIARTFSPLIYAIGLTLAAGAIASPGALAHGHDGMMGHDMVEKMDINHDGMISAKEHADFASTMFAKMDANHDGMLDKGEMEAGHAMHHEHEDNDEHEKDEHKKGEQREHGDSMPMHRDRMAMMDANHDGMISVTEHADAAKTMFDQADTNHDGMLGKDEMKAAHEQREETREKREDMKEKSEEAKESKDDGTTP